MNLAEIATQDIAGETLAKRSLSEALETTDVALNLYTIPPGEGLSGGIHAHMDQEEVFVVLDGVAAFETFDGTVTVEEGEAIRFAPGEFQWGHNARDSVLRLLAIGAPKETEDIRIPAACPACGHDTLRLDFEDGSLTFDCPSCDASHLPADCPTCGHPDLGIGLGEESETEVVCQQCGTRYDEPPLQ